MTKKRTVTKTKKTKKREQEHFLRVSDLDNETSYIIPLKLSDVIRLNEADGIQAQRAIVIDIARLRGVRKDDGRECTGEVLLHE
jgi:hypothetical protein